jgi:hypothetical protein
MQDERDRIGDGNHGRKRKVHSKCDRGFEVLAPRSYKISRSDPAQYFSGFIYRKR